MRKNRRKSSKKYSPVKKKLYTEKFIESSTLYLSNENWNIINRCIFGYLKTVHPERNIEFGNFEELYSVFAKKQKKVFEGKNNLKNWLASIYISFEHPIVHKRSRYRDVPIGDEPISKPDIAPDYNLKRRVPRKVKKTDSKEVHLSPQYLKYISSPQWREKRKQAFAHHGRICSRCSSKTYLQVHHLTYDNLGDEKMEDLSILCKVCHQKEHGRKF